MQLKSSDALFHMPSHKCAQISLWQILSDFSDSWFCTSTKQHCTRVPPRVPPADCGATSCYCACNDMTIHCIAWDPYCIGVEIATQYRKCCNWVFRIKTKLPLIIDWIYVYIACNDMTIHCIAWNLYCIGVKIATQYRKCCNWLFRIKTELPLIIDWIISFLSGMAEINQNLSIY